MARIEVMMGILIEKKNRAYDQKVLLGCGGLLLVTAVILCALLIMAVNADRQAARYPNSTPISNHSNYTGLPTHYRWDNSYITRDGFTAVYNWYSITFDLGSESRALGKCILLEGTAAQFIVERRTSVLLCDTPNGQMIYVTRSTSFN